MFDDLYVTSRNYVYNKKTRRLFKVTDDTKTVLLQYAGIDDLREKDSLLYEQFNPVLNKLNANASFSTNDYSQESELSTLQLVISNECNLSCRYCYANSGTYDRETTKMGFVVAVDALDTMFSMYQHIGSIVFFGGEPLLNIDLIDKICEYLQSKYQGRYDVIGMMSNLYYLSDRIIAVIKKYKIAVSSSLDGDEYHNAHRVTKDGKNSFKQVVANIHRLLVEANQPVAIEATMTNLHSDTAWCEEEVKEYLSKEFPISNYTVNKMMPFNEEMQSLQYSGVTSTIRDAVDHFIQNGSCDMRINDLVAVMTGKMCADLLCNAGSGQLSVFPNGDIYPCHIYAMDKEQRFCLGNVTNFDKQQFYINRGLIVDFNTKSTYRKCRECDANQLCSSCMGMNLVIKSDLPHDDLYCDVYRKYYNDLIEVYAELLDSPTRLVAFKNRLRDVNTLCRSC